MKRQELHNYIRKEIINELTEDAAADKAAKDKVGQLLGAVLQNRTYVDRKTGRAK